MTNKEQIEETINDAEAVLSFIGFHFESMYDNGKDILLRECYDLKQQAEKLISLFESGREQQPL